MVSTRRAPASSRPSLAIRAHRWCRSDALGPQTSRFRGQDATPAAPRLIPIAGCRRVRPRRWAGRGRADPDSPKSCESHRATGSRPGPGVGRHIECMSTHRPGTPAGEVEPMCSSGAGARSRRRRPEYDRRRLGGRRSPARPARSGIATWPPAPGSRDISPDETGAEALKRRVFRSIPADRR